MAAAKGNQYAKGRRDGGGRKGTGVEYANLMKLWAAWTDPKLREEITQENRRRK